MSQQVTPIGHPLLTGVRVIADTLDDMGSYDPDWLPPEVKADLLVELARQAERLAALKLRVLAGAEDVADQTGARSAAAWLAHQTRVRPGRLIHEQALGHALHQRHPKTQAGLATGEFTVAHAQAVADAVDALPAGIDPNIRVQAEATLVGYCAQFTPPEVRRLGRRILHVLDPGTADEEDRKKLEADEARAYDTASMTLTPLGDGRTRIAAEIPDTTAGILTAALDALTSPRRHPTTGTAGQPGTGPVIPLADPATGAKIPAPVRRGQAFCALIEHLPTDGLPSAGGSPITILVTLDFEKLREDTGTATCATGEDVSPGQARRWACVHGIVPVVLGGDSVPLDLGRTRRLFSHHQITAHTVRHRECQAEGCTIPAAWCEAHHRTPWAAGGKTDLADLALLCPHHHHRIHDPRYTHQWNSTETVTFHLRT